MVHVTQPVTSIQHRRRVVVVDIHILRSTVLFHVQLLALKDEAAETRTRFTQPANIGNYEDNPSLFQSNFPRQHRFTRRP